MTTVYTQHPLSAAFPAMADDEYQSLKDSIKTIGVQNPITIFEGMVLDGWHRYQAAIDVHEDCPAVDLDDQMDPRDFVLAQNKNRRQINKSQLAMAVAAVYEWQPHGTNRWAGRSAPGALLQKTADQMAVIAGVGKRTMVQAKLVESKASPEVKAAVKTGAMSVKKAAEMLAPAPAHKPVLAPLPAPEPELPPEAAYSELDAAQDQIKELQDQLAVACMGSTDAAAHAQAAAMMADLRHQVTTLEATLKAVKTSRDLLQNENAELRKQVIRQRKEIDALTSSRSASPYGSPPIAYRGPNGETWSGSGLMPRWLTSVIEMTGQPKEHFRVPA